MKRFFVITIASLFVCCSNNNLHSFYSKGLISDYPNDKLYDYYVIIPHAGCPGCTSNAEEFLRKNKNSSRYFFVITNYSSQKSLFLKIGKDLIEYNNVVLDSTSSYYAKFYEKKMYPISIMLKKNEIERIFVGTP